MIELTEDTYNQAKELAKTDKRLADGLLLLDKLNNELSIAQANLDKAVKKLVEQEHSIVTYVIDGGGHY